jgi:nucleoside-diphosphate-sugar epimerase
MPATCLVTGATGAVGPAVVHACAARGYQVRALVRHAPPEGTLPQGVEIVTGDIAEKPTAEAAVAGVDVVLHLAAMLHRFELSAEERRAVERTNVEGTRVLLREALDARVRRFVLFSTIAVYGPTGGARVDEDAPPNPDTDYARSKRRAEELVLAAGSVGTVLRLAAVYGSRVKGNYLDLVTALAAGKYVSIGAGANRRTLVHEHDAAAAAAIAATHPGAAGQVYNVTDGSCHELRTIVAAICAALGRPEPRAHVPAAPVRLLAHAGDRLARVAGRSGWPLAQRLEKYFDDVCVDGTRISRELGFQPERTLVSGWREAVESMRRAGQLPPVRRKPRSDPH